jgi:hypothetical protein
LRLNCAFLPITEAPLKPDHHSDVLHSTAVRGGDNRGGSRDDIDIGIGGNRGVSRGDIDNGGNRGGSRGDIGVGGSVCSSSRND